MKQTDPITANQWHKKNEAIIIDVREQHEFDEYHIEGAILTPLSILPQAIQNVDFDTDKKIIFQCLKGGRSAQAIDFLQDNLLKNHDLYNLEGGILAWVEADLAVMKT